MKKRYDAIDGLRAFSCIGIVAMHVRANAYTQLKGFFFESIIPSFTNLVFLFMVISAFGMCCGYYEKVIDKKVDIETFYKKRYLKVLPFFAFLCFFEFAMNPSLESLYEVFANLTLCFGLIPNANISIIGVGWFLGVVFAFYLMFPFFCFLISNKTRAWCALVASLVMNYLCRVYFNAGRQSIVYCFAFFMAGGIVYIYRESILRIPCIKWISMAVLIFMVAVYYACSQTIIIILLTDVCALVYAISIDGRSVLNNSLTRVLGGMSFEIYLCHMMVYRLCEVIHLLNIVSNEYVNYASIVIIVLLVSCGFAMVSKKIFTVIEQKIEVLRLLKSQ